MINYNETNGAQPIHPCTITLNGFKSSGLSKREFFTCQFFANLASQTQPHIRGNAAYHAAWSVRCADALVTELSKAK